jgi:uridine kinase
MIKQTQLFDFNHIYWMGGSPCSGKSTMSALLAEKYGFEVYRCDDHFNQHLSQARSDQYPRLSQLKTMDFNQIWMRPVNELVTGEIAVYVEEFEMILEDLKNISSNRPVIAEGAALLPKLVQNVIKKQHKAIWVVPSADFQLSVYPNRGSWVQDILSQCQHPGQAFQNWMQRDIEFGKQVLSDAKALGFATLVVDGERSVAENFRLVEQLYGLG